MRHTSAYDIVRYGIWINFLFLSEVFYSNVSSSRESSRAGTYSKKVTYEVGSTVLPSSIMKPKPPIEDKSKGLSSEFHTKHFLFEFWILKRSRRWNRGGDAKKWTRRYNSNHLLCLITTVQPTFTRLNVGICSKLSK